jgi:hypothetical protein
MRIRLIGGSVAFALVALVSSAAPSDAYIPQPWYSDGLSNNPGGNDCAFSSYEQCKENSRACTAYATYCGSAPQLHASN